MPQTEQYRRDFEVQAPDTHAQQNRMLEKDAVSERYALMTSTTRGAEVAIFEALSVVGGGMLTPIGIGSLGGRELRPSSDLDLLWVCPVGSDVGRAIQAAQDATVWLRERGLKPDNKLRPNGRDGAMARTVEDYREFYRTTDDLLELRMLVKARPLKASTEADEFVRMISSEVYAKPPNPEQRQDMRLEQERRDAFFLTNPQIGLRLKGGMREITFIVQCMQWQYGGVSPELRVTGTLPAIQALRDCQYLSSADSDLLRESYLKMYELRCAGDYEITSIAQEMRAQVHKLYLELFAT